MDDRTETICDLLLGAAYSDEHFHEHEKQVILDHLAKLLGGDEVPEAVAARVDHFDPEGFDAAATAKSFASESDDEKMALLKLIGAIHDADDEFSFDEDRYVRQVAEALGVDADKLVGLTLDYEVEELRESFEKLREDPPPVPGGDA